ncbi:MAG: guanylate kinase [Methylacidiphilales bacterium]|nr:guanylate kinase [Candidatus Methylacidiphilales bacterium]
MNPETNPTRRGIIFVVSAPSGTGKSTLCQNLRKTPDFVFSVSCTTRKPRPGESDGVDYYFLADDEFQSRVARGDFLEWAVVHGNRYGTPKDKVLDLVGKGTDVLLDIDVEGASKIRAIADPRVQDALVDVFIMPPDSRELERRLRKRGTETEEQIQVRLKNAIREMGMWREYKYTVVSSTMEEDLAKFRAIMTAERSLSKRSEHKA